MIDSAKNGKNPWQSNKTIERDEFCENQNTYYKQDIQAKISGFIEAFQQIIKDFQVKDFDELKVLVLTMTKEISMGNV